MRAVRLFFTLILSTSFWPARCDFLWVPYFYYTPETSLAGGLLAIQRIGKMVDGRSSSGRYYLTYTQNRQTIFNLSPVLYFDKNNKKVALEVRHVDFPQYFYGTGSDTQPDRRVLYDFLSNSVSGAYTTNLLRRYHTTVGLKQERNKIKVIETSDGEWTEPLLGPLPRTEINTARLGFDWDSRDFPRSPTKGEYHQINYFYSWVPGGTAWHRWDMDLRAYYRTPNSQTIAAQFFAATMSGDIIPFDQLVELGGASRMRGIYQGRLRGKSAWSKQVEYRHRFRLKWSWSAFAGLGGAYKDGEKLNKVYLAGGGGVHYFLDTKRRTKGRLDVGIGDSGASFYVVLDDSF